jgi:hypothetical protein
MGSPLPRYAFQPFSPLVREPRPLRSPAISHEHNARNPFGFSPIRRPHHRVPARAAIVAGIKTRVAKLVQVSCQILLVPPCSYNLCLRWSFVRHLRLNLPSRRRRCLPHVLVQRTGVNGQNRHETTQSSARPYIGPRLAHSPASCPGKLGCCCGQRASSGTCRPLLASRASARNSQWANRTHTCLRSGKPNCQTNAHRPRRGRLEGGRPP